MPESVTTFVSFKRFFLCFSDNISLMDLLESGLAQGF